MVYNESSLRHCTVVSKSPGVPRGFLACYVHPSILISLLRHFYFTDSKCIYLFNTMSHIMTQESHNDNVISHLQKYHHACENPRGPIVGQEYIYSVNVLNGPICYLEPKK